MRGPSRAALIIGYQTPNSTFLPGASEDVRNISDFFRSPNGDAFKVDEIKTFYNPSCKKIISYVTRVSADYMPIYFSGHGFTNK